METQNTQQFRVSKDAPVAVVGSSVVTPTQGQLQTEQSEPEPTRYRELLQTFDKTLQQWRANVCVPEYCVLDKKQDGDEITSEWTFRIGYPPTIPPRIIPRRFFKTEKEDGKAEVAVSVHSTTGGLIDDIVFEAFGFTNEAFNDPYTNERISNLTILLKGFYPLTASPGYPKLYDFIIAERTQTKKKRALEYRVRYPDGQIRMEIGKVSHGGNFVPGVPKDPETLLEPHALTLFNLMDKLIPEALPPTSQPGRGTLERAIPTLQAPRRTPKG